MSLSNNLKASWTSESILADSFLVGAHWLCFRLPEHKLVFLDPLNSTVGSKRSRLTDNILLPLLLSSCFGFSALSTFLSFFLPTEAADVPLPLLLLPLLLPNCRPEVC